MDLECFEESFENMITRNNIEFSYDNYCCHYAVGGQNVTVHAMDLMGCYAKGEFYEAMMTTFSMLVAGILIKIIKKDIMYVRKQGEVRLQFKLYGWIQFFMLNENQFCIIILNTVY